MKVFALVGKSGTGKSFHCTDLVREHKIDSIIDDGLLISKNQILAGKSAKHEKTKMASVRCAIFDNEQHATEIKNALKNKALESVLIVGTSENMVKLIAKRLDLPEIGNIFHIEDIATPEEIATASFMRNKKGKHIIPAPVVEVKKQFSGYLLNSLRNHLSEKTVIRPSYSYLGSFRISPRVFSDICHFELSKMPEIVQIHKIQSVPDFNGCIDINVEISLKYPCDIPKISREVQKLLSKSIEYSTSIIVKSVNVSIKTLT